MENNFNLRKFLVENKLTSTSRTIKENRQNIPDDIIWTDEDEHSAGQGTFNQYDLSSSELDHYDVELLGYSPSTGKAYTAFTSGEYGETDYDNVDGVEELDQRETENYIERLKKYHPDHYRSITSNQVPELNRTTNEKLTKREQALKEQVLKTISESSYSDSYSSKASKLVGKQLTNIVDIFSKSGEDEQKEIMDAITKAEQETGTEVTPVEKRILLQHAGWIRTLAYRMER